MKWEDLRSSSNIEDFKGRDFSRGVGAVIGVVAYFMGFNSLALLNMADALTHPQTI